VLGTPLLLCVKVFKRYQGIQLTEIADLSYAYWIILGSLDIISTKI